MSESNSTTPHRPPLRPYTFSHRGDIQGLRGVAVLLVVLYHAHAGFSGGYVGVDVFFVISGFVITAGILRQMCGEVPKTFSFRAFYARRVRRLLPSLCVASSLTLLLSTFLAPLSSLESLRRTAIAATFFHANQFLLTSVDYFAAAASDNALLHTWSLSVEEQFYFVFPCLLVMSVWLARRRWQTATRPLYLVVGATLSTLFVVSFLATLYFSFAPEPPFGAESARRATFFMAPFRAWEFGVGVLLAIALPFLRRHTTRVAPWIGLSGLLIITASAMLYDEATLFPGVAALVPVLGSALVILAGCLRCDDQPVRPWHILEHRVLMRMGDLSYGWYLWHWPPLVFIAATWPGDDPALAMLATIPLSLGLAWLNERYLERSMQRVHRGVSEGRRDLVLLLICLVFPVLAVFAQRGVLHLLASDEELSGIEQSEAEYMAIGCTGQAYDVTRTACQWRAEGVRARPWRVVLIGDSNARQYIPALREVVPQIGGELHAAVRLRCPFSDLRPHFHDELDEECVRWVEETMAEIERHPPDVVLVTSSFDNYLSVEGWRFDSPDGAHRYSDRASQIKALQRSTHRLTRRLLSAGVSHVVFIKPAPKFRTLEAFGQGTGDPWIRFAAACSLAKLWLFREHCDVVRPLHDEDGAARRWASVAFGRVVYEEELGDERVHEVVVDDMICPHGLCRSSSEDGVWLYRDAGHMWPAGVRRTRPAFKGVLVPLMAR